MLKMRICFEQMCISECLALTECTVVYRDAVKVRQCLFKYALIQGGTLETGEHEGAICSAWGYKGTLRPPAQVYFPPSKPCASVPNLPYHQVTYGAEQVEPACFSTLPSSSEQRTEAKLCPRSAQARLGTPPTQTLCFLEFVMQGGRLDSSH